MRSPAHGRGSLWRPSQSSPQSNGNSAYELLNADEDQEFGANPACSELAYQLLLQSDEDIIFIVNTVIQARPHLRKEFVKPTSSWFPSAMNAGRKSEAGAKCARNLRRFEGDDAIEMDPTPRKGAELALANFKPAKGGQEPIVQFSCGHYYVSESESNVTCGVMRIGDLSGPSQIGYETHDVSAIAGQTYTATKRVLIFKPGEVYKDFNIGILENDEWDVTQTFGVKLTPENTVGAQTGRSLWFCHIHVINDDAFPTNRYAEEIANKTLEDIPPAGLLIEYLKLQWENGPIRNGSKKLILVGQIHNLVFMLKLFLGVFLLKEVFPASTDPQLLHEKHIGLVVIAAINVITFGVLHFLERHKFEWKVGGMSRAMLQKAILRKYLTCDTSAKQDLKDGILIMGIARDTKDVVAFGYMGFIALLNTIGGLFTLCLFQCLAPIVFHLPPRMAAFVPMLIFPTVLGLIMSLRNKMTIEMLIGRNNQESDIVGEVVETTKDYQLIMDFDCRGHAVQNFEKEIAEFNMADKESLQMLCNNAHFAPWITVLFLAMYTFTGGSQVIDGDLSLAMYLTNVAVFTQMGGAYGHILAMCVNIQTSFPALLRITKLLNLPADDATRMNFIRYKCETSVKLLQQATLDNKARADLGTADAPVDINMLPVPIDTLPIWVKDLSLTHLHTMQMQAGRTSSNDIEASLTLTGYVEIKQGRLVSIIGPNSEGKSTLLRILGGSILPDAEACAQGQLFVPCHLRIIHIPCEPCFFRGPLLGNMTYGVRAGDPDGDKSRVKAIFRDLGLPFKVMNLLEEASAHFENWIDVLSTSQLHLLSIVRALVANPQVICIHKPSEKHSAEQGRQLLGVLKMFVEGGGLQQDAATIAKRKPRPRTCIMTNVKAIANEFADDIVFVSRSGMRMIDKDAVRDDMIR